MMKRYIVFAEGPGGNGSGGGAEGEVNKTAGTNRTVTSKKRARSTQTGTNRTTTSKKRPRGNQS